MLSCMTHMHEVLYALVCNTDYVIFFFFMHKKNFIENQHDGKLLLFRDRRTPRWLHNKAHKPYIEGSKDDIRHRTKPYSEGSSNNNNNKKKKHQHTNKNNNMINTYKLYKNRQHKAWSQSGSSQEQQLLEMSCAAENLEPISHPCIQSHRTM